ncbi:MAG: 6-hydroxymethylpterin diphosphokinase MptE-like protein [Phycisphaerae bacterium]
MNATTAINTIFLENMRQLWRHDPRLAQTLDDLPPDASLDLHPTRTNDKTAGITTDDGRTLWLHSRHDPRREANDFCRALETEDAACVILCGLGLGYHLKALFERFGDETVVFVSEPDLVTIKTALETTDLSRELATGHVEILTRLDKARFHERTSRHATRLMLGTVFAVPPTARIHNAEFHAACRKAITDFAAFAKMSLITLVRNAGLTCRNIANNLPTYVTSPPPEILHRKFSGIPAILVAAGPSLARNVDELKKSGDRAVLIAAQTTLRPLLSRGIKPHFVTTLDFSDLSRQFFEALNIPDDVVLVAEPKASWHAVDAFVGGSTEQRRRVVMLDNPFAHRCLGEQLAKRAPIEAGATVMHLAFYLAQWLGCDPIIFIGQDLAFSGHCYYAPGVAIHRSWGPELGRFVTLELKEWERIVRQRELLRKIEDIHCREIYTDEQMFTYLEQFERDFARSAARIIDATEGGARKAGATTMPLNEAIEKFCKRSIDPRCFSYLNANRFNVATLKPARDVLHTRRQELDVFRRLCEETRSLLKELEALLGNPKKFNHRIARIDELRTLVQEQDVIFQMVRDVSQLAELQKFAADRRLAVDAVEGKARARHQLKRDRRFIESLLEGCDELESIFDESLARFDETLAESEDRNEAAP